MKKETINNKLVLRKTIRCKDCKNNPSRLFDLLISEDGQVYIETKCKKDGVVLSDISDEIRSMIEQLNISSCA